MSSIANIARSFAIRAMLEALRHPHRVPCLETDRAWLDYTQLNMSERERKRHRIADGIDGIMVHVTGVPGGFGASRGDLAWAQQQIETGGKYVRANTQSPDEYRRTLAVIRRLTGASGRDRGMPYHRMVIRSGDGLILNPWYEYTFHGNTGNARWCGFAIDGDFAREELTPEIIEASRWGLTSFAEYMAKRLSRKPRITAHRCYARNRGRDPGEAVWREIVKPVCDELDLEIHSVAVGGGRKIPW